MVYRHLLYIAAVKISQLFITIVHFCAVIAYLNSMQVMAFIYVCSVMNTVFLQNNVFYSINDIVFFYSIVLVVL